MTDKLETAKIEPRFLDETGERALVNDAARHPTKAPTHPPVQSPPSRLQRLMLGLAAMVIASAMFAPAVVGIPLYTKGEPREALVMQTILRTGQLALPLRNEDEIPSKPPLFHWIGAALSLVQGEVTETSAKLPSTIASVATIVATLLFGLRYLSLQHALLGAVVLATSAQWVSSSTIARVDMVLAAAISLGLFAFYSAYVRRQAIPWYCYAAGAAAVLAKGPIGMVLPGAIIFLFLVWQRDWDYLWNKLNLRAAFGWLLVALSWYAAAAYSGGEAFVEKLILRENVLRVLDAEAGKVGHDHPFYWYGPALLAGSAPWCFFLPLALWGLVSSKQRPANSTPSSETAKPMAFLGIWFAVTYVIFSLADSKRGVYLIPAYPALALLLASAVNDLLERGKDDPDRSPTILKVWIAATLVLVALPWALILLHASGIVSMSIVDPIISESDRRNLGPILLMIDANARALAAGGLTVSLAAALGWTFVRRRAWTAAMATTTCALAITYAVGGGFFLREIAEHQTPRDFMPEVLATVGPDEALFSFGRTMYGEIFYGRRPIALLPNEESVRQELPQWVLVDESSSESFKLATGAQLYDEVLGYDYKGHPRADRLLLLRRQDAETAAAAEAAEKAQP